MNYIDSSDPRFRNPLFSAVKLVKNVDISKNKYSGYGAGFDMKELFHFLLTDLIKMQSFLEQT